MKKTIAILLVALMALTLFAACGSKTDNDNSDKNDAGEPAKSDPTPVPDPNAELYGTWAVDFASMMSEEEKAAMEAMGVSLDQLKMEFTFNADGTGKAVMEMMGESENADFTYTVKDGKLEMTMTVDGETNTQTTD